MKKPRPPEIELAQMVLSWDLRTEKGLRAHALARLVLGDREPDLVKEFLIVEILNLEQDMPRLEDLKKSLLDMTPDELRTKIAKIREDRIIRKDKPKTRVQKAERVTKTKKNLVDFLSSMSEEEREALMKELGA